jgi:large subunit ribosomal protein L25
MPEIVVEARPRAEFGKNVNRRLRAEGFIPGVVYGAKKDPVPVAVSPKDIGTILRSATGENTLFDLQLDGGRRKVILKEFQVEPIKGKLLHADFYEVALDQALEVTVHVELTGVPVGVKVEGGILDFVTREIEIECLPTQIPDKLSLDVSALHVGQHLEASSLVLPDGVTLVEEPNRVVVSVSVAKAEEEAPAAEGALAEGAPAEPEVIGRGKADEDEAEGDDE